MCDSVRVRVVMCDSVRVKVVMCDSVRVGVVMCDSVRVRVVICGSITITLWVGHWEGDGCHGKIQSGWWSRSLQLKASPGPGLCRRKERQSMSHDLIHVTSHTTTHQSAERTLSFDQDSRENTAH